MPTASPLATPSANGHSHAPVMIQHLQALSSPVPQGSPYGLGFAMSPHPGSAGFMPYPSPGLFGSPSPMLHPGYSMQGHMTQMPSPYRRGSTGDPLDELAGGSAGGRPGLQSSSLGRTDSFPFHMNIMPAPSTSHDANEASGEPSAAEIRRRSIESSVLKKKVKEEPTPSESGESSKSKSPSSNLLPGIEEVDGSSRAASENGRDQGEEEGEGAISERNASEDTTSQPNTFSDSHRSSPSPPIRGSMILTPASTQMFHRPLVSGSDTPDEFCMSNEALPLVAVEGKEVPEPEGGDGIYFQQRRLSESNAHNHSTSGMEGEWAGGQEMDLETGSDTAKFGVRIETMSLADAVMGGAIKSGSEERDDYMPLFASLAHTPQQVAEIQRLREEEAQRKEHGRTRNQSDSATG